MSKVTKGLRQPREINQEEKKALEMLANIRDLDHDKAESLLERLTPKCVSVLWDLPLSG